MSWRETPLVRTAHMRLIFHSQCVSCFVGKYGDTFRSCVKKIKSYSLSFKSAYAFVACVRGNNS